MLARTPNTPSDDNEKLRIEARMRRSWYGKKVGVTTATVGACIESGPLDRREAKLYAPVVHRERCQNRLSMGLPSPASFLAIPTLYAEVTARIVSEMVHGLFHALLPFAAWRAAAAPATNHPPSAPTSPTPSSSTAAGAPLVGLFGVGWLTLEFAGLPLKLHAAALKRLQNRCTPANALPIYARRRRRCSAYRRWSTRGWTPRLLLEAGWACVDGVLGNDTAEVLGAVGGHHGGRRRALRRRGARRVGYAQRCAGHGGGNAGKVYQVLVNVLLLPHPLPAQPLLSQTSHVRMQVEQASLPILPSLPPSPSPSPSTRYAFYRPTPPPCAPHRAPPAREVARQDPRVGVQPLIEDPEGTSAVLIAQLVDVCLSVAPDSDGDADVDADAQLVNLCTACIAQIKARVESEGGMSGFIGALLTIEAVVARFP
ncbi:hypothetical protein B0H11DRAFT_1931986 [Mycena galericulata]|nr:hypothetical protein B0H11DRAFT_1931986 [Mycena galericulata]